MIQNRASAAFPCHAAAGVTPAYARKGFLDGRQAPHQAGDCLYVSRCDAAMAGIRVHVGATADGWISSRAGLLVRYAMTSFLRGNRVCASMRMRSTGLMRRKRSMRGAHRRRAIHGSRQNAGPRRRELRAACSRECLRLIDVEGMSACSASNGKPVRSNKG